MFVVGGAAASVLGVVWGGASLALLATGNRPAVPASVASSAIGSLPAHLTDPASAWSAPYSDLLPGPVAYWACTVVGGFELCWGGDVEFAVEAVLLEPVRVILSSSRCQACGGASCGCSCRELVGGSRSTAVAGLGGCRRLCWRAEVGPPVFVLAGGLVQAAGRYSLMSPLQVACRSICWPGHVGAHQTSDARLRRREGQELLRGRHDGPDLPARWPVRGRTSSFRPQ